MGTSISIDILKIENPSISASTPLHHHNHNHNHNKDQQSQTTTKVSSTARQVSVPPTVWIRVPRDDGSAVLAALSSWVGAISSHSSSSSSSYSSGVPAAATAAAGTVVDGGPEESESANEDGGVIGVAWRICAKGNYLSAIMHGSGADVFVP